MALHNATPHALPHRHRRFLLYGAETANAIAAVLLLVGLSFYTHHRFGWGPRENFTVAAFQGALYMLGALLAQKISQRWGREKSLLGLYAGMMALAVSVGICASMGWAATTALLAVLETGLVAASWPMLQSLISSAGQASLLSKRLGFYNIIWSTAGAIAVASSGAVIQYTPAWVFFGIIAAGHLLAGSLIAYSTRSTAPHIDAALSPTRPGHRSAGATPPTPPTPQVEIVRRLRLALWLSRIALPSTYVVIYSIAPAMPSLHAIKQLPPATATLAGSVWLIARAAAFVATGNTTFWHKRPSLMFLASIAMLFAFIGTIIPGSLAGMDLIRALSIMAAAQIILGFSIGTIYSASLYLGMAVSEGSTAHGGYHEALIGLGQILGPLLGATLQWMYPDTLWPAVAGISAIVLISVLFEAAVGLRASGGIMATLHRASGRIMRGL